MNEPTPERDLVPEATAHLSASRLEQLAEGSLGEAEANAARVHLSSCQRCSAELEAFGSLFAMLGELPRFAPSPAFAGAVMARVRIAPAESWYAALLRRLIPTTRRGWLLLGTALTAPATPFIALAVWLLFQPLVTPTTLLQWGQLRIQSGAEASIAWLGEWFMTSLVGEGLIALYTSVLSVSTNALSGVIAFLAVAIPLSAWALVRLTRSPSGKVSYAN